MCVPGQLDTIILQIAASAAAKAPVATGYSDTGIVTSYTPTVKVYSALLQPGSYVFELAGNFKTSLTKGYSYFYCFKLNNPSTGLWTTVDSAKKTLVNTKYSSASYQPIHLKSDIVTLTTAKSVALFHGVLKTDPAEMFDTEMFNSNVIVFKL